MALSSEPSSHHHREERANQFGILYNPTQQMFIKSSYTPHVIENTAKNSKTEKDQEAAIMTKEKGSPKHAGKGAKSGKGGGHSVRKDDDGRKISWKSIDKKNTNFFFCRRRFVIMFDVGQDKKGGHGGGGGGGGGSPSKKDDNKKERQYAHHNHGDKHFHDKFHVVKPIVVKESNDDHIGEELFEHLKEEKKLHRQHLHDLHHPHHPQHPHPHQTGAVH